MQQIEDGQDTPAHLGSNMRYQLVWTQTNSWTSIGDNGTYWYVDITFGYFSLELNLKVIYWNGSTSLKIDIQCNLGCLSTSRPPAAPEDKDVLLEQYHIARSQGMWTAFYFSAPAAQSHANTWICFHATQETYREEIKLLGHDAVSDIAWRERKQFWLKACYWWVYGPVHKAQTPKLMIPTDEEGWI